MANYSPEMSDFIARKTIELENAYAFDDEQDMEVILIAMMEAGLNPLTAMEWFSQSFKNVVLPLWISWEQWETFIINKTRQLQQTSEKNHDADDDRGVTTR